MTRWFSRPRRAGKTREAILWASQEQPGGPLRYIVCHSHDEAGRVFRESYDSDGNPTIRFPLTVGEALDHHGQSVLFAVDNVDIILRGLFRNPIPLATFTTDEPGDTTMPRRSAWIPDIPGPVLRSILIAEPRRTIDGKQYPCGCFRRSDTIWMCERHIQQREAL